MSYGDEASGPAELETPLDFCMKGSSPAGARWRRAKVPATPWSLSQGVWLRAGGLPLCSPVGPGLRAVNPELVSQ